MKTPKLTELAAHCVAGACNPSGIIRSFADAITELSPSEIKDHPAVKMILGQLSYLCKESLGPTPEAMEQYDRWVEWNKSGSDLTWQQAEAIHIQRGRWDKMGDPVLVIGGDGAVAVDVGTMVLCIERDGYTHS